MTGLGPDAAHRAARELLASVGLPSDAAERIEITGDDPVYQTPYRLGTAGAAVQAAIGVAVSEVWALRSGARQNIAVDLRAAAASLNGHTYIRLNGKPVVRDMEPVSGFYRVRDGRWIYFQCNFPHLRDAAAKALGARATPEAFEAACAGAGGRELETRLFEHGAVGAFVRSPQEWRAEPQAISVRRLPLIDIARIGDSPPEPLPRGERPLSRVRVLDLTRLIAGPYCARTLAEYGADVLKITCADLPDSGGPIEFDAGMGKLAAHLDLRKSGDLHRLKDLVQDADVFSQAYRPESLAAKGLSADDLAALRPGIIHASMSAWSHEGPWRARRGFDSVVQAAAGISHRCGTSGKPGLLPVSGLDYLGGYLMGLGTIVALTRRTREGGSWRVRVSLAGVAHWLESLGLLEEGAIVGVPKALSEAEVEALSIERDAFAGRLRHLKPALRLEETPAGWSRTPVPPGHNAPAWPER